jgi:hypothetical protein
VKRLIVAVLACSVFMFGCESTPPRTSEGGVSKVTAKVKTNAEGITVEQKNVLNRLTMDNNPGAIKHLYVVSAMSGQTLIYSTVKGKVTSSGKRLTPNSVVPPVGYTSDVDDGFDVRFGNKTRKTVEVLQDDGTYGHSIPYLYWWDAQDRYHQHYVTGGQILHVSDQPLAVGEVIINMEVTK